MKEKREIQKPFKAYRIVLKKCNILQAVRPLKWEILFLRPASILLTYLIPIIFSSNYEKVAFLLDGVAGD